MAKFSTAPLNDIRTLEKLNKELHESYWNIMHGASFAMRGTWFYQLGKPPIIEEPTDHTILLQHGLDYCQKHNIPVCHNCKLCKEKNYFGFAAWNGAIHLSAIRPDNPKFQYERRFPTAERQAKTIWHEIAHIEFKHRGKKDKRPLRRRELEADMTAYLFCLLNGRSYYNNTIHYVSSYFRFNHTLAEMASRCEYDVLNMVRQLTMEVR